MLTRRLLDFLKSSFVRLFTFYCQLMADFRDKRKIVALTYYVTVGIWPCFGWYIFIHYLVRPNRPYIHIKVGKFNQ